MKDGLEDRIDKRELIDTDWQLLKALVRMWHSVRYEQIPGTPFICGEAGEKDSMGMPEYFMICPNYGLDGFATYKKDKDYDAPSW